MDSNRVLDFWLTTYPKDYPWLKYLWRSIDLYATGFRQCVLVLEEQDPEPAGLPEYVAVKRCRDYRGTSIPGYWGQSIEGLRSFLYTDAHTIWFLESDAPFTRPIDVLADSDWPSERPKLFYDIWENVGPAEKWRRACRELLKPIPAPYEMMRTHPFIYPREVVESCWNHIQSHINIFSYVESVHQEISQFNILGNWMFHLNSLNDDKICQPLSVPHSVVPAKCMHQFWSHHGVEHPDIIRELSILGLA